MKIKQIKKIVKWNNLYKGDNLRIAVVDLMGKHSKKVIWTIKQFLPNAKIFELDVRKKETFEWIANNNIHLVNMSTSDTNSNVFKASQNSFLVTSGGNAYDKGETMRDKKAKYWLQVGAIDETLEHIAYSSWGRDKIDIATFSGIDSPFGKLNGTSFSSPVMVACVGQYFERYHEIFDKYPTVQVAYDFLDRNTHNVMPFNSDSDLKIGRGLFILPEEYTFKKIEIKFLKGESESLPKVSIDDGDGKLYYELITKAVIKNGRSFLGLRDVANLIGSNIEWDNVSRTITIYKQQKDR